MFVPKQLPLVLIAGKSVVKTRIHVKIDKNTKIMDIASALVNWASNP